MSFITRQGRTLLVATAAVGALGFTSGAGAQTDSAFVPFVVNVDAMIGAVCSDSKTGAIIDSNAISVTAKAGEEVILRLPLLQTDGIAFFGTRGRTNAPAVISSHGGKITVNLSAQSYKSAEVSLYTVGGKRIMRRNVSAAGAANERITRSNVATGIYMLSVRGADGNAVTSRLTHSGGGLDISVTFGGQNVSDDRRLPKKAAVAEWFVMVSAVASDYVDSLYWITPAAGTNPKQNITLRKKGEKTADSAFVPFVVNADPDKAKSVFLEAHVVENGIVAEDYILLVAQPVGKEFVLRLPFFAEHNSGVVNVWAIGINASPSATAIGYSKDYKRWYNQLYVRKGMNTRLEITLEPNDVSVGCLSGFIKDDAVCVGSWDGVDLWYKTKNLNIDAGNSWCYSGDCQKYGRLYDWPTAQTVCPSGWRLPTEIEVQRLMSFTRIESNLKTFVGTSPPSDSDYQWWMGTGESFSYFPYAGNANRLECCFGNSYNGGEAFVRCVK